MSGSRKQHGYRPQSFDGVHPLGRYPSAPADVPFGSRVFLNGEILEGCIAASVKGGWAHTALREETRKNYLGGGVVFSMPLDEVDSNLKKNPYYYFAEDWFLFCTGIDQPHDEIRYGTVTYELIPEFHDQ